MASRDLTRKFVERRQQRVRTKPGRAARGAGVRQAGLVASSGYSSDASDMEAPHPAAPTLPPVWVDLVDTLEADVAKIEKLAKEQQALCTKRLMVSFDDNSETMLDGEIEKITRDVTKLFRSCEQSLKRVARSDADVAEVSGSEQTIRANIQRSMAMRIQALNAEFRQAQREYLRRLKAQKDGTDTTFDFLSGGDKDDGGDGFNEQQLAAVVDIEALVSERDNEIRKIAESIQELSTIFKELAVLVIDQGTLLDRIDFNMEQVAEHTRKGVVEIEQAEQYQKAARPRICIAVLMLFICIMLVALVVKHRK
ncbi:t-SNARE [Pelagophyceae sp. CCMP2097]|nr:t-SNARE [Pelagophyceae sp. CCMP2097]